MTKSVVTVVTAASSIDLVSLQVAKAELGVSAPDDVIMLKRRITMASDAIARRCNRVLASETVTEQVILDYDQAAFALDRYPISAISAVTVGGSALDPSAWLLDSEAGILRNVSGTGIGVWASIGATIAYTGGYVLPSGAPPALAEACLVMIRSGWFSRNRDPTVRSKDIYGVMRTDYQVPTASSGAGMVGSLPPDVEALISYFRRLVV